MKNRSAWRKREPSFVVVIEDPSHVAGQHRLPGLSRSGTSIQKRLITALTVVTALTVALWCIVGGLHKESSWRCHPRGAGAAPEHLPPSLVGGSPSCCMRVTTHAHDGRSRVGIPGGCSRST